MAQDGDVLVHQLDQLFVLWREPGERRRHTIGLLSQSDDGGYAFAYDLSGVTEATARGFGLLQEFPELRGPEAPYLSDQLFATFAQRIPSPKRPDFQAMLEKWGVQDPTDELQILASSGGILQTDQLELAEYRSCEDDLRFPLRFRLSGETHYPGSGQLTKGEAVALSRRPDNPYDRFATVVLTIAGTIAGYVPRQYSRLFSRLIDEHVSLDARVVDRLDLPSNLDRWVIEVRALR